MTKRRLNLPNQDAVIKYIWKADGRRIKAAEIARHFDIYQGKPFGPADASRDIGDFLHKCEDRAFKEWDVVIGSCRHGYFLFKTGNDMAEYHGYMTKKSDGILNTRDEKLRKAAIQIKNGIPESSLRAIGLLN